MNLRFESTDDGIIDIEESAIDYAEDVGKASSKIRILSGECHAGLYSHEVLIEAFRKAHERGVSIDVLSGPIISVLVIDNEKYSGLLELQKEGVVTLYRRRTRGNAEHYRTIDESFAKVENWHESLEELRVRKSRECKDVKPFVEQFDSYLQQSDVVKDPWKDFLVLSPGEIESLRNNCIDFYPGYSFSDLNIDQLRDVFQGLQVFWSDECKDWVKSYKKIKSYLDKAFAAH